MNTIQRVSNILKRMGELAEIGNSPSIGALLERTAKLIEFNMQDGVNAIIKMYGGMGSLNDVILYNGNQPLVDENKEFDTLRSELFDMCLKLRD
jgi:hypothetical protein